MRYVQYQYSDSEWAVAPPEAVDRDAGKIVTRAAGRETYCVRNDIAAAIGRVNSGEGVIILTDMFGGTPSNLSISLLEEGRVEVVAGLNLPMLVKLARVRKDFNLHKAAAAAQDAGRKYINIASQVLQGE